MLIVFMLLWIILNGRITGEVLIFGLILTVPVYLFFCLAMGYRSRWEWNVLKSIPWACRYAGTLIKEIVKANIAVIRLILSDRYEAEPCLRTFKKPMKNHRHNVLLANSITLTPGTITVSLDRDGTYVVHALDKEFAEGIEESVFIDLLTELEEKDEH
ncbi:MAG: Na+/H+ antiporter subunit E [Lachnospiraceae bacterium]|jgi:multicomponent Na+:H+ antiporter subunit E|nr:Na+/H+ antiporter subunit E [Lachnospiraceae bacterium]